jgi:hypothetical protein
MICKAWLSDSLQRLFPNGPVGKCKKLEIACARGERISFQVGYRLDMERKMPVDVSMDVLEAANFPVTIRRVGCVPMPHFNSNTPDGELDGKGMIPGFVPDILYPENKAMVSAKEVNAFWVNVNIPSGAKSGERLLTVKLHNNGKCLASLTVKLLISKILLKPRHNFHMTHWFYADAICDWYKVEPFSKEFWLICEKYIRNSVEHGNDTLYVPVFTPPLDGVKRPIQLLHVTRSQKGCYQFKWNLVKQWIDLAKKCGVTHFEWTHLFSQWGVKNAIRIYEKHGSEQKLLWPVETPAISKTYREFLRQYFKALKRFLKKEMLEDISFFHISDEPHGEEHLTNYRNARALALELAPWMKVMDALSDIRFGREGLTDMPIPSIETAMEFVKEKIPCWVYFCCGPREKYLNRLLDTPLAKIRMSGWLFYRFGFLGFLHWGYNYWYRSQSQQMIDPFIITDGTNWPNWAYGDTFLVYPGQDGPIDSMRHEVFFESMQDYALLQTIGVNPDGKDLILLKDFENFPKTSKWLKQMRRKLLK